MFDKLIVSTSILIQLIATFSCMAQNNEKILGLNHYNGIHLSQGYTNHELHPKATGTLKAIMLFAKFPDAERKEKTEDLYERLVPDAVKFYKESSYGKFNLKVDAHHKWYDMNNPSTHKGYDCSKHHTHKAYVREVMEKADKAVDFSKYSVVYVVATFNKGTYNSPTLLCMKGDGIKADGIEICNVVTFGNDCRNEEWGWQTLVHETGHVLGLPDLYNYNRSKEYKSVHKFIGSWDPMGYHKNASQFLAWHKHKLGWLDDNQFFIVNKGKVQKELSHIEQKGGLKALVIPMSNSRGLVVEVKNLNSKKPEDGVLIYSVDTKGKSGNGSIQIIRAKEDNDTQNKHLAKRYISHYDALFFEGGKYTEKNITVKVLKKTDGGFLIEVEAL